MPSMTVNLEGDNVWPDLNDREVINVMGEGHPPIKIAVLRGGMQSGLPSVSIRVDYADGKSLVTETSAILFCMAAQAILVRYPGLFD